MAPHRFKLNLTAHAGPVALGLLAFLHVLGHVAWLLFTPAADPLHAVVDNIMQFTGPLVVLTLALGLDKWSGHGLKWSPLLIGLAALANATGQMIWTINEHVLHSTSTPSWSDLPWLSTYPLLLGGILLMPAQRLSTATRMRVLLDGLMVMLAAATFSWYFLLGPLLQGTMSSLYATATNIAYPLGDLVLLVSLIVLFVRCGQGTRRVAVYLLMVALTIVIVTECIYFYQTAQDTYATGSLLDVGWPAGYMLVAIAAWTLRKAKGSATESVDRDPLHGLWGFVPYALVPAVATLLGWTWLQPNDSFLEAGVLAGSGALVMVIVVRQLAALVENRRLYASLQAAYGQMDLAYSAMEEQNAALALANDRLETLATTDPLTGLPNHGALVSCLDRELERARRFDRPCAVLFVDVDHFKVLNDSSGHQAGDAALRDLAAVGHTVLRSLDVFGRWGGEEFLAILPDTNGTQAVAVAERLRATVAERVYVAASGQRLTCSIGVATFPNSGKSRDELVAAADSAMYAAKRLGRNQVRDAAGPDPLGLGTFLTGQHHSIESQLSGIVEALVALTDLHDSTSTSDERATVLANELALRLTSDTTVAHGVRLAARLRYVGKLAIPRDVLDRPGPLTDAERALIQGYPAVGAEIVGRVPALQEVAEFIRSHHERWDGAGQSHGLTSNAIPLGSRILAVVDSYMAMTSTRPYRRALAPAEALAELRRCSAGRYDWQVVEALADVLVSEFGASLPDSQADVRPAA